MQMHFSEGNFQKEIVKTAEIADLIYTISNFEKKITKSTFVHRVISILLSSNLVQKVFGGK